MNKITLDFETRSLVDLTKTTMDRYAQDPSTEALMLAVKKGEGPTRWWAPDFVRDKISNPALLRRFVTTQQLKGAMADPCWVKEAHNAGFEMAIWQHIMVDRYGFQPIPINEWRCSAAKAALHALPRSLAGATAARGSAEQKDSGGHALMLKMCKPLTPLKAQYEALTEYLGGEFTEVKAEYSPKIVKARWYSEPEDKFLVRWHEDFEGLLEYCLQDVEAEHSFSSGLPDIPPQEQSLWELDQKINARGLPIDLDACTKMKRFTQEACVEELEKFRNATGGVVDSPSCYAAFATWLRTQGVQCSGVRAAEVERMRDLGDLPPHISAALKIASELNKSSVAKYDALTRGCSPDGRIRGTMMYHGAATGRWAGRTFQPQNLPRGTFQDAEEAVELIKLEEYGAVRAMWGSPMGTASTCIRAMVCAPEGKELIAADFNAIEGRVLAWLADEQTTLDIYREGKNPYCAVAADCFGVPYDDIFNGHKNGDPAMTKLRAKGKVGDLACGFGGGQGAVARFAPDLDFKERSEIVQQWRATHPKTKTFWYALTDAAANAILNPGKVYSVGKVAYRYSKSYGFLMCRLPSGRKLYYAEPTCHIKWIGPGEEARKALKTPGVPFSFGTVTVNATEEGKIEFLDSSSGIEQTFPKECIGRSPLWRKESAIIEARTVDSISGKWVKRQLSHLILSENVTQAVARDLLANALFKLEAKGYEVVLHVHDEAVSVVQEGTGTVEEFESTMCDLPEWADGLPVTAEGWRAKRFKK